MADGIDQAADAFRASISPNAPTRPRDESGRFTATSSQPESLFAERQIESEPDEPVAEERKPSGKQRNAPQSGKAPAEEGRERSERAEDTTEGGRHAAADDGHELQEGEGGLDEGEEVEDAREKEKEGEEADVEETAKYEVTVDGEKMEVSLPEALRGYIREATFHSRLRKINEARQAVEQEAQQTAQMRTAYQQRLAEADRLLAEFTPPEPDWDREFAADPASARARQKAFQEIYTKRQSISAEIQRSQEQAKAEYDARSQRYAVDQFSQFVQEEKIPDEKALNDTLGMMRNYLRSEGFDEGEIASTYDKRMLKVARKAALYDQMMAKEKPKPIIPGKGKTLTPGVATPVQAGTRRSLDDAMNKLARTGRREDAELFFQRLIR